MSTDPAGREAALRHHVERHRACTRCADAGHIGQARPIFSGHAGQRILLVGQAPGPVETDTGRPFAGRAGRELMRWLGRAGLGSEEEVRGRVWITSTTTCFPGRRPDGSGDRRPGAAEVALCAPWLDRLLELLEPRLVLPVGSLALSRLLAGRRALDGAVGRVFDAAGVERDMPRADDRRLLLPLPHPSGQSRWLNDAGRAARLEAALARLGALARWAESG